MARRRHQNQRSRSSPGSERSYLEYLASTPAPRTTRGEIVRMLRGGEDTWLELKVRFSNVEKLVAEIIALANTDGGAIVFGVNDQLRIEGVDDLENIEEQLRDICANQIQPPILPYINKVAFDSGRRIVILEVGTENRPHRTMDDRFYLREGSSKREATIEDLSAIYEEAHLTRFEQVPVFQSSWERDIDESLFWSYIRGVNPGYWGDSTRGFPTESVLRDMGLGVRMSERTIPTVGGLLLFGMNDRMVELMPRADLTLTRYSGRDAASPVVEKTRLSGNLLRLFDGAMNFIERYVDLWDARPNRRTLAASAGEDGFLTGRAGYHRGVMIEALINSLAHRDWSARDRTARISIFDDAIEFINPSVMPQLPIISLRYGIACSPNPRLKAVLTNRHYGLPATSGGIPMIFEETMRFVKRAPEGPSLANNEFRLKIHGLTLD
ncbi:MAG: helix-turn-helix domain-containing protein [Blastocatellales bacterium]